MPIAFRSVLRCHPLLLILCLSTATTVSAQSSGVELKLSGGASWQTSNDVQIPNTTAGTRFSLKDIAGKGPWLAPRFEAIWNMNNKHGIRVLLAPLSYAETGTTDEPIEFAGSRFDASSPVRAEYRFNSWRAGYRYHLAEREQWDFWVGATLKVRDAEIKLTQGNTSSSDDDLGVVPLLYLAGEYRMGDRWRLAADLDGLAGGPGRAIDAGLSLNYRLNTNWWLGAEYRALEGGADIDELYNFAWFNSALLTLSYRPAGS